MDIKSIFKKILRKIALSFTKNNRFFRCLIKEMIHESQKRSDDVSEMILIKNLNEQLANDQERKLSPINRAMPVHLTIETTLNCNLRCIMCDDEERRRINTTDSVMPFGLFERIIKETFSTLKEVNLTAIGEPLMCPYLSRILDILRAHSIRLELITNFSILSDALMEKLLKVLSNLCISFDGASKKTFEKIRRGSNFDTIIKNIKRFNEARRRLNEGEKPRLLFNVVLMRSNIEELPNIIKLARDLEVHSVSCSHVLIFERALDEESLFRHKMLANEFMLKAQKRANRLGVSLNMPKLFRIDPINNDLSLDKTRFISNEHRTCDFLWKRSFIRFNGDVAPCCAPRRPIMGNIYRQSFEEIWNGEIYREMRRRLNTQDPFECCKFCNIYFQSVTNPDDNEAAFFLYDN